MRPLRFLPLLLSVLAACSHEAPARGGERRGAEGEIVLDGERTPVRWSDGDSFEILDGRFRGRDTRLMAYNSLESYGPVHRWGSWTARELFEIARTSKELAAAEVWECSYGGRDDGYQRMLLDCPGVARAIVGAGHGMVYAVDEAPDAALLEVQRSAQGRGVGMWNKGVPARIVSSVHSARPGEKAYNRVVDTATGRTEMLPHNERYATCEEVCEGEGNDRSCLVNVPFKQRYRNPPDCLR